MNDITSLAFLRATLVMKMMLRQPIAATRTHPITGAQPSREPVLVLAEALDLPLRERNRLLESGGFANVFRETPLSADEMAHMRGMLQLSSIDICPMPPSHWTVIGTYC